MQSDMFKSSAPLIFLKKRWGCAYRDRCAY